MSADLFASRRGRVAVAGAIALLFFALRVALLFARDPFFDELYTRWISARSFGGILEALRHDSGPPLYYFIAKLFPSIPALRFFSLACSTAALFLLLRFERIGNARFLAAALLAVYPPAVLLSVDARSYALAALLLAIGVLAIDRDRPLLAVAMLVLAAYTHYYAVLFLPLLLVRRWLLSFVVACALFAPGLWLATHQPREATAWLAQSPFDGLVNVSFAGRYVEALFQPAPLWLVAVAWIALAIACARSMRFAWAVLVPIAGVLAFGLAGRPIYFPMRFESVIAVPLVLWTASSLERWRPAVRRVLFATLMMIGLVVCWVGILDHMRRPLDPYRTAARIAAKSASRPIVASGYAWLEVASTGRQPIAFPPEQAEHPGWRTRTPADAATLPAGELVWVGEIEGPELAVIRKGRRVRPIFVDRGVAVLLVGPKPM